MPDMKKKTFTVGAVLVISMRTIVTLEIVTLAKVKRAVTTLAIVELASTALR
jgi:hypothetical protein